MYKIIFYCFQSAAAGYNQKNAYSNMNEEQEERLNENKPNEKIKTETVQGDVYPNEKMKDKMDQEIGREDSFVVKDFKSRLKRELDTKYVKATESEQIIHKNFIMNQSESISKDDFLESSLANQRDMLEDFMNLEQIKDLQK